MDQHIKYINDQPINSWYLYWDFISTEYNQSHELSDQFADECIRVGISDRSDRCDHEWQIFYAIEVCKKLPHLAEYLYSPIEECLIATNLGQTGAIILLPFVVSIDPRNKIRDIYHNEIKDLWLAVKENEKYISSLITSLSYDPMYNRIANAAESGYYKETIDTRYLEYNNKDLGRLRDIMFDVVNNRGKSVLI